MKSRKKISIGVLLAIVIIAVGVYFTSAKFRKPTITYKEHVIKKDNLEITVQATGTVQPENRLVVKPQIPGRIDEIQAQEGQSVKAGQIGIFYSIN